MLEDLEDKLKELKGSEPNKYFMIEEYQDMLNKLGNTPFFCKLSNKKMIISKTLLELFGYKAEDFILECMNYKMPLFEYFIFNTEDSILKVTVRSS